MVAGLSWLREIASQSRACPRAGLVAEELDCASPRPPSQKLCLCCRHCLPCVVLMQQAMCCEEVPSH